LWIILAYACGSIPVGVMIGRLLGFDPRAVGSGNVGATNVARAGGAGAAAATFAGDLCKGLIPVLVGRAIGCLPPVLAAVGFAAFLGSIMSVFLRFKGGRGVATSAGVWLGLAPVAFAVILVVFAAALAATRIVSVGSLAAAAVLPPTVAAIHSPRPYILLAILMTAVVIFRHRTNIERLLEGEEPRIGAPKS
jgi:acyl phosphate:glycerol-3-phosphate acyltransferase